MWLSATLCLVLGAAVTPITPASVAAVLDPVFAQCSPAGTPGASVAVVHEGKVVLLKGYGTADERSGEAVDPSRHLFRAASVSKLITATAVMQLVESGKVDLDTDVNHYLPSPIVPEAFGKPVTLRHLLQHTAGFDDEFLGMARPTPENLPTLGEYLKTGLPRRVFPPGEFCSYSNHGVALAGLVVEAISGKSFAQYSREHIFAPLGMEHSYFDLVPTNETPLARGHWIGLFGGPTKPAGYDYPLTIPASSLATTSADMARFMLAHLGDGTLDGQTILRAETCETMHAAHPFGPAGVAIGFFERWHNQRRCLTHTGLIWGYASLLAIVPDENFGLYVTLNSEDGVLYDRAMDALMDTFFPRGDKVLDNRLLQPRLAQDSAEHPPKKEWLMEMEQVCGLYRHTRYTRHSFLKFGLLVAGRAAEYEILPGPEQGSLTQRHRGTGRETTWYLWKDGLYKTASHRDEIQLDLDSGSGAKFLRGDDGQAEFFVNRSTTYERIAWWESTHRMVAAFACAMLPVLLWLFSRAIPAARRRHSALPAWLRRSIDLQCAALVLFMIGIGLVLTTLNPFSVAYGPPMAMYPLLCLPLLATAAWCVTMLGIPTLLLKSQVGWWVRAQALLLVPTVGLALLILYYWNLLGFQMG